MPVAETIVEENLQRFKTAKTLRMNQILNKCRNFHINVYQVIKYSFPQVFAKGGGLLSYVIIIFKHLTFE